MNEQLANRKEAGVLLASKLTHYANSQDVLVLGLPRGGVPVAFEIAKALNLPLDIFLVRKLGAPRRKELAIGAIAMGGIIVMNQDILEWLKIKQSAIESIIHHEKQELQRRDRAYRGNRPFPEIENRTIIIVDDGIATGATLRVAITALKQQNPKSIVIAIPVAPPSILREFQDLVNEIICLKQPKSLSSISLWYQDFSQTTDEEVCQLLNIANFGNNSNYDNISNHNS